MKPTEARNPRSMQLGSLSAIEVVRLMNDEERVVFDAVDAAVPDIAAAADAVARIHATGGRVFLLGSGTSGLLAALDAAELPPTFGVPADRFPVLVARGEDDVDQAPARLAEAGCGPGDGVIGLAASGTTPFVLGGLRYGRGVDAWTCGIANNPGTPVLDAVDVAILLETGPEVLTGSTRLKAGTAQKLVLNRISTAAMVRCGKVRSNLMIEVGPGNAKLRDRCVRIVAELTGLDVAASEVLLGEQGWSIRAAIDAHEGD